jgi:hypothetical protein
LVNEFEFEEGREVNEFEFGDVGSNDGELGLDFLKRS